MLMMFLAATSNLYHLSIVAWFSVLTTSYVQTILIINVTQKGLKIIVQVGNMKETSI